MKTNVYYRKKCGNLGILQVATLDHKIAIQSAKDFLFEQKERVNGAILALVNNKQDDVIK